VALRVQSPVSAQGEQNACQQQRKEKVDDAVGEQRRQHARAASE
jgi:hypothetical protein